MSATFKNAKKKLSQAELRKFMNEHKEKQKPSKTIDSPLAKYNDSGQLMCILCQSIVRSENVWQVHINSKQHRNNVTEAKRLKEKTNNFTTGAKRQAATALPEVPTKKIKSILKNSTSKATSETTIEVKVEESKGPPPDFFDSNKKKKENEAEAEKMQVDEDKGDETLPEGFFDDPKLDAKARNVVYKDPIEEEWEKFQKAIKDADHESAAIIAEDQEEATTERQIDEIDEQMKNWSRVLNLEKKKVDIISNVVETKMEIKEESEGSGDEDFDEFLDWRAKKAYK